MGDDLLESCGSGALALKPGIDHEPPQADLRYGRRCGSKRFIVKHDEPRRRLADVDGAIPGFLAEERFRERDGIAGYEPLLIGFDGEARDPTNSLSRDLAEGYLHGVGAPWLTGAERMAFQVSSPEGEASSLAPPTGSNPSC